MRQLEKNSLLKSYLIMDYVCPANITKQFCSFFDVMRFLCQPRLKEKVFTVDAIDNLDHNQTWSTAKTSFRGTGISIFQFSLIVNQVFEYEMSESASDVEIWLSACYTTVLPTKSDTVNPRILTSNPFQIENILDKSRRWFTSIIDHINEKETIPKINGSSFYSNQQVVNFAHSVTSVMLPLL